MFYVPAQESKLPLDFRSEFTKLYPRTTLQTFIINIYILPPKEKFLFIYVFGVIDEVCV